MIRTNSFTIKISFSISLICISLFLFLLSYKEFTKINLDDAISVKDMDINYFDKDNFQKYYEKIDIENLTDPIFDEKKSKDYSKSITPNSLFDIFEKDKKTDEKLITQNESTAKDKIIDGKKEIIDETIEDTFKEIKVLSNDEIERICNLLISNEGKISNQEHLQSLHDRHTSDTVCPRCGSDLVERTVKDTGSIFLGCSSYPKCKFSKDIQVPYEKNGPVSIWVVIFVLVVILVLLTN